MTKPPATITNKSVVSREVVCITETIAALNDVEVKVADSFVMNWIFRPI